MACDVDDRAGSLVHRFAPSGAEEGRFLLFYCKQRFVGRLGLASRSLGIDHPAILPLWHESARVAKKYTTRSYGVTMLMPLAGICGMWCLRTCWIPRRSLPMPRHDLAYNEQAKDACAAHTFQGTAALPASVAGGARPTGSRPAHDHWPWLRCAPRHPHPPASDKG